MNILHMKYAVEVADTGSLNKASEQLLIAQPNLSRCIKELEADLGISIFERSPKGMVLTPDGEDFISYARKILSEIDEVEKVYKFGKVKKQRFSISVPRASYISEAFSMLTLNIGKEPIELFYKETNSQHTIDNVLNGDYKLGIIRYAEVYDQYFKTMMDEKGLNYELISEFRYLLVASQDSKLIHLPEIHYSDLYDMIEIAHADPYVPSLSLAAVKKAELPDQIHRRIFIFERGSQFELLDYNPETFMWVSPLPDQILNRYHLFQRECTDNQRLYRDVLIYRKGYHLTDLDREFITALSESKHAYLKN